MKTKSILAAILISISMILTSCHKEDEPKPKIADSTEYVFDE